jgi:hypothetical protein
MENSLHILFQSKGGAGKTLVSWFVAQWIESRFPGTLAAFDVDQENDTFAQYKAFNAAHVNVMREGTHNVEPKKFDPWMETLLDLRKNIVIDTGSNSFSPVLSYFIENDVFGMWKEEGKKVYIHTIVGGGNMYQDTAGGFADLAKTADFPIIVWENEHFGKLVSDNGKHFTETSLFKSAAKNIIGRVILHKRNEDTYVQDINKITSARLTFEQAKQDERFSLMEKRRIKQMVDDTFTQLDAAEW